ncbi:uncharacterized protein LOC117648082 [Thrips palmi]|uniref:Uncharacterized protein LOC117648082 n=1 Tax=Thrips palmi TaxID=161013 RepID=A0A6P8Z7R4_THRPL|nr:uncharacterized protein LOC117648082 [Thrips palmi]
MPLRSSLCSKRAVNLVALCNNESSPTFKLSSPMPSCSTISPVSSWWDNVFEASDIVQPCHPSNFPSEKNVNSVKRKLCFSPVKVADIIPCETSPNPSKLPLTSKDNILDKTPVTASKLCLTPNDNIPWGSSPAASKLLSAVNDRKCLPNRSDVAEVLSPRCEVVSGISCIQELTNQSTGLDFKKSDDFRATPNLSNCGDTTCDVKLLYPSQSKILAAKFALNAGIEHITIKGTLKKARSLKPSCKDSCKRCTIPKLSHSERLEIYNEFWALKDHVKQWIFIKNVVSCNAPKNKTSAPGAKGEKLSSRTYHFFVCGARKRVCKTMFKSTLSICDSWVDSALSHFSSAGMACDKRGKKRV